MNSAPIGVFDSGIGGLTSVRRLIQLLPNEDIVYLGDTGRVPYGTRSKETILKYARQDVQFLLRHGVKAIIIACNTVSAAAFSELSPEINIPVFEVVTPASKKAAALTRNGKIGVIGTPASINSAAYENALLLENPELTVTSAACPLFVPLVENGRFGADDVAVQAIARDYLDPVLLQGIDTLILGCTHYPLLREAISRIAGPGIELVDSGAATAEFASMRLRELGMLNEKSGSGVRSYYVTDSVESFSSLATMFLEDDVSGCVYKTTLD